MIEGGMMIPVERARWQELGRLLLGKAVKCSRYLCESRTGSIFYCQLDDVIKIQPLLPVTIRRMTPDDISAMSYIIDEDEATLFRERLEEGKTGFVALDGERIIHYSWLTFKEEFESWLGITIHCGTGMGYSFNLYTLPEYKGKNIAPAVLSEHLASMKENGCHTALTVVGSKNTASLHTVMKVGFQKGPSFRRTIVLRRKSSSVTIDGAAVPLWK